MTTSKDNNDGWRFPPDMAALLGLCFVLLPIAGLGGMIIPGILAAKHKGDLSLLWIAVSLSSIGVVLLFLARLPLYRQKKFRQIGPGGVGCVPQAALPVGMVYYRPWFISACHAYNPPQINPTSRTSPPQPPAAIALSLGRKSTTQCLTF